MKIAMIGHKRIPSREGGVEIVVEELSTRMAEQGHRVTAYNRGVIGFKKERDYKGVHVVTVPTINMKSLDALLYSFFATVHALFGGYDVIHYHAEGPCAMLWIPHLFGIRTVATIHGLDWQRAKWGGIATKYLKFGEKMAAKHADELIVLSKNVQQYFKHTYDRETNFIPNGVNKPIKREPQIIKEKYGLVKDSYILFLARIVPEKGLHYLLNAFKGFDTDKKLVVAGGSSHTNEYVEEIKKKAADDNRVIMTGFVQGRELEELFSNCYLYVLPSDVEGMPISLLEAMSYGCACLVSDIEENIEVTQDYVDSFKKSDVKDLKDKLEFIVNNQKKYENDKEELLKYMNINFNWDIVTRNTLLLYSF